MTTDSFNEQYYATSVKLKIPENLYFSTFCQNSTQTTKLKSNQTLFDRTDSNLTAFFYQKILMYFNHFQNHNFTVMPKVKPNNGDETKSDISHATYSNLTSYLFYQKC